MATVSSNRFAELLARAKATVTSAAEKEAADKMAADVEKHQPVEIDYTNLIGMPSPLTDEHEEAVVDALRSMIEVAVDTEEAKKGGKVIGVARDDITLNPLQLEFVEAVLAGEDVCLIGAAGTGKTTSVRTLTRRLVEAATLPKMQQSTKWLVEGKPGIAILSYTRKAVNNIRHAVIDELKVHVLTIHKLLEFMPIFYEIEDPNRPGEFKSTMKFEPQRNSSNPLPSSLKVVGFEESSMIGVDLYGLLQDALPHQHQEFFLGDLQQLPPVFGLAILGFKLNELRTVELTEVYRQALESPIINLAWKIIEGNPHIFDPTVIYEEKYSEVLKKKVRRARVPSLEALEADNEHGYLKFQVWQKKLSPDMAVNTCVKQFQAWEENGYYKPDEDIIMLPFNKAFGTIELNKGIAQHLGEKRDALVHEVIAGYNKHYLAVGDRVLYDKEDAFIITISKNYDYMGKTTLPASHKLDRWGHYREKLSDSEVAEAHQEASEFELKAAEEFLSSSVDEITDRVQAASHGIGIRLAYADPEDEPILLDKATQINNLLGGYALTIHKMQGSENERCFLVMHHSHAIANQRETLYTATTRAKRWLHVICESDTFYRGVMSQKVKGDTLAEKAEWFKGKRDASTKKAEEELVAQGSAKKQMAMIKGQKAVKLADLVTVARNQEAQQSLSNYWTKAREVFGIHIGYVPRLDYNIRSGAALGKAYCKQHKISLNPVWLMVNDPECQREMLHDTMVHEICHIVEWRIYKTVGHGPNWKNCMIRMDAPPERTYTGNTLPPWMEAKKDLLRKVLLANEAVLEEQMTEEVSSDVDDSEPEEGGK